MSNTRGKGRPSLEEAADIDRKIRESAVRVLLEQGEAATMNAVAVAAGLSRRTLYARYPSKSDLFLKVISELLQGAGNLEYDRSGSVEERLAHYIEAAFDAISRPQSRAMHRLLSIDPTYIGVLKAEMFAATRRIFRDPLVALLTDAQLAGEIEADDIEGIARIVIRSVFTESLVSEQEALFGPTHSGPQEYARFLAKILVLGMAPRG